MDVVAKVLLEHTVEQTVENTVDCTVEHTVKQTGKHGVELTVDCDTRLWYVLWDGLLKKRLNKLFSIPLNTPSSATQPSCAMYDLYMRIYKRKRVLNV